ncbi:hypothetical protein F5Y18DRAFT_423523 [Xylariaceae sp. FL1019]|nr:hypothetical protein F5Y18DRAFT_423523 [Xylariaceae sp. FL1019]
MADIESHLAGTASELLLPNLQDEHPDKIDTSESLLKHLWGNCNDADAKKKAKVKSQTCIYVNVQGRFYRAGSRGYQGGPTEHEQIERPETPSGPQRDHRHNQGIRGGNPTEGGRHDS